LVIASDAEYSAKHSWRSSCSQAALSAMRGRVARGMALIVLRAIELRKTILPPLVCPLPDQLVPTLFPGAGPFRLGPERQSTR
jgi:hypothetical protein